MNGVSLSLSEVLVVQLILLILYAPTVLVILYDSEVFTHETIAI